MKKKQLILKLSKKKKKTHINATARANKSFKSLYTQVWAVSTLDEFRRLLGKVLNTNENSHLISNQSILLIFKIVTSTLLRFQQGSELLFKYS